MTRTASPGAKMTSALTELSATQSTASKAYAKASKAVAEFTAALTSATDPDEIADFMESINDIVNVKKKKSPKAKDPDAPKRPPSAYLEFQKGGAYTQLKADNPTVRRQDLLQRFSKQWAEMPRRRRKCVLFYLASAWEGFGIHGEGARGRRDGSERRTF